ncbi:MAG: hypothetical protein WBE37_04790 [Bryobacteraceae bacterium]
MTSRILTLNPPVDGLSAIVNVLGRVGPGEANAADDVRAVQRLIQIAGKTKQVATGIGLPNCTGHFDAATGFWIYQLQHFQIGRHPHQIVDGIISPAHGATYAAGTYWAIVLLNSFAKANNPTEFAAFLNAGGV